MKKTKNSNLDELMQELIREHGIVNVVESIISSCDASADFAHLCNDKQTENYWREVAVKIFDVIKRIGNILPPAKKY